MIKTTEQGPGLYNWIRVVCRPNSDDGAVCEGLREEDQVVVDDRGGLAAVASGPASLLQPLHPACTAPPLLTGGEA